MEKLRSEIRATFEKEQAAHPPVTSLRRNVVAAVTAQRRPARNYQWVAVAAALVLGILVVVGLMSTRFVQRPIGQAKQHASPVADYGPPPAGVPLLYVHDPDHQTWLIGYDWTGKPRGTVKLAHAMPSIQMAPDGLSFLSTPAAKGGAPEFLDRLGQPISTPATTPYSGGIWSDDNRQLCSVQLDQDLFTWTLISQVPGSASRRVALIARDKGIGQTGISVASCSVRNDLAIAVRESIAWPSELWVIRLSDGQVLSHHTYQASELMTLVAGGDGVYVAENSGRSIGAAHGATKTFIRRVSDWSVVFTLEPTTQVLGFNTDDSLILVNKSPASTGPAHLEVIFWHGQQSIWTYDGPQALGSILPLSKGFAIALRTPTTFQPSKCGNLPLPPCTEIQDPLRDVVVVHGTGMTYAIPGRHSTTW